MGAKPKIQFSASLQSKNNGASRIYIVKAHIRDKPLRTFTAVVYGPSDESRVASWCEMNQDELPADRGMVLIELT
jgi:hypothetical protein